jgi:hypothetical protein
MIKAMGSLITGKNLGGQFASHEFRPVYNPYVQGAKSGQTIRAGESIPEGHGIVGFTYQNAPGGEHAGTLIHTRPEVLKRSLVTRAWRDRD